MQKSIFITGASTGLGKAAAILFANNGWKVIATMRKPDQATDLKQLSNIQVLPLDVTDSKQIQSTCGQAIDLGVDVVFNNAGYGLAGPLEGASDEQVRRQLDTNLLGVIRVTKAFIPYFRKKKSGIFITTTSIGGHIAFPFNSVYNATKFALEGWSESMTYELSPFGIQVKTVAPGGISTDFISRSLVLSKHEAYTQQVEKVTAVLTDPKRQAKYSTPEEIAEVVYEAATDGKSQLRYVAGKNAILMYRVRRWLGYQFFMKQVRKMVLK